MAMYGGKAVTPNFDKFAELPGTVVFDRAYVQQAICCPTRSSFLTGRRPDTTKVWDLKTQFRVSGGANWTTLPQFFRERGYWTAGMGKVRILLPHVQGVGEPPSWDIHTRAYAQTLTRTQTQTHTHARAHTHTHIHTPVDCSTACGTDEREIEWQDTALTPLRQNKAGTPCHARTKSLTPWTCTCFPDTQVFHPVMYEGKTDDVAGGSWSAPYFHARGPQGNNMTMCWNENESPDETFVDMQLAAHAVETLQNASTMGVPFFVAVGYHRPHLPWDVPQHFYDLYPDGDIQLADHNTPPSDYNVTGAEPWSWDPESGPRHCGPLKELGRSMPEYALVPDAVALKFRRGYYAAVSQTDHNFGVLLDTLDKLSLSASTIVCFIGDHGWQLGDLGEFGKKTNFERATRAPFLIRDPTLSSAAARSSALVEFVDIMPTLLVGVVSSYISCLFFLLLAFVSMLTHTHTHTHTIAVLLHCPYLLLPFLTSAVRLTTVCVLAVHAGFDGIRRSTHVP